MSKFITNGDVFDYKLCIHAAHMLADGIENYFKIIRRVYRNKTDNKDYIDLMAWTALSEARRLLKWMKELEGSNAQYLVCFTVERVEKLIKKIERFRGKLNATWPDHVDC